MTTDVKVIEEEPEDDGPPILVHPEWRRRWPFLVQGLTHPGPERAWDLGLFGSAPAGEVLSRWEELRSWAGCSEVVHGRQPHGTTVRFHAPSEPGLRLASPGDGHLTRSAGLLVAVSVADCVPVYLVAPELPAVAMVHAGWRGAAGGILERGLAAFRDLLGVLASELHLHLGPSICGRCYEVGPEVHEALGDRPPPGPAPVDLAAHLARRALTAGVARARVSRSGHCTRCGEVDLFSHRGGDAGRQMAFLGIR